MVSGEPAEIIRRAESFADVVARDRVPDHLQDFESTEALAQPLAFDIVAAHERSNDKPPAWA